MDSGASSPGSMGTKSYITKGLGNPASYNSSSHGAGRRMSRSQAKKNLTQESLNEAMKGKAWNQQPAALLDEHPAAYKGIDTCDGLPKGHDQDRPHTAAGGEL